MDKQQGPQGVLSASGAYETLNLVDSHVFPPLVDGKTKRVGASDLERLVPCSLVLLPRAGTGSKSCHAHARHAHAHHARARQAKGAASAPRLLAPYAVLDPLNQLL